MELQNIIEALKTKDDLFEFQNDTCTILSSKEANSLALKMIAADDIAFEMSVIFEYFDLEIHSLIGDYRYTNLKKQMKEWYAE